MNSRHLNIRGKLMCGFGLVLAIAALQSGLAALRLRAVNEQSSFIVHNALPSVRVLGQLEADLTRVRIDRLKMLLDDPDASLAEAADDADAAQAAWDTHWAAYSKLIDSPDERRLAQQLSVSEGSYAALSADIRRLTMAHDRVALHALLLGPALSSFKAATQDLRKLVDINAAGADEAGGRSEAVYAESRTLLAASLGAMLALGAAIAWLLARGLARAAGTAVAAAERISRGDLGEDIVTDRGDEVGQLLVALGAMQAKLRAVVSQVRTNAESVADASAEIAASTIDLSSRTEEQASALEETAAAMEQLASTVQSNADHARQGHRTAVDASDIAQSGGAVVERVVEHMRRIDESSGRIGDIIGVIDGIAFQTNILALNAAVEAARAGEQGRGFAVVAKEVRSLAQRSADAAREIKGLIATSVERVESGTALVEQAGRTTGSVVSSIRGVTDVMGTISAAIVEQSSGVTQIEQAVSQMDQATQQNAALVEQSSAAAESLKDKARELVQAVAFFKIGTPASRTRADAVDVSAYAAIADKWANS